MPVQEKTKRKLPATAVLSLGFLALILIGTILLSLPFSSASGQFTNPFDSAFTAVSAACVTGLTTVDTATTWNTFGHGVILVLIQIGGLGFMTIAVLLSLIVRRNVSPKERMLVAMSYNLDSFESIPRLVRRIAIGTFLVEGIGALLLSVRFIPDFGVAAGIRKSIFHSVSAFCNAGFDTIGTGNPAIAGMSYYVADPIVNFTLTFLIVIGGIGFLVWGDLINLISKRKRLSVYSRFVLIITAILLFGGMLLFAIAEWNNPATLDSLSNPAQKLMASLFQSASWRTAGFAMFSNGDFMQSSGILGILLMFIGGASGSTAGGVKMVTVGVLIYTVFCVAIGRKQTVAFGRKITDNTFVRAASVVTVQFTVALLGILLISVTDDIPVMDVIYEVISAISTVGVTTGVTPQLSAFARCVVMILMYFGRVGILTVTYAVLNHINNRNDTLTYPDAKMLIG